MLVVALDETWMVVVPLSLWTPVGHCPRWSWWRGLIVFVCSFPIEVEFRCLSVNICLMGVLVAEVLLVDGLIVTRVLR